jgi:hypothetical protein
MEWHEATGASVIPALWAAVTDGLFAGRVLLYLTPSPLKGHPGPTEGGLAMVAPANREGGVVNGPTRRAGWWSVN